MANIWYAVTTTLPSATLAAEYLKWLTSGHVEAVISGGAHSAMIVELEADPSDPLPPGSRRVMTQYTFPNEHAFDRYVRETAPALRSEGLAKFGPDKLVTMTRRVGRVV